MIGPFSRPTHPPHVERSRSRSAWLTLLLALPAVLGGCLLPQPDTPPVPPAPQAGRNAAPASAAKPAAEAARPTGSAGSASSGAAGDAAANNAEGLIQNNAGGMIANNAGGLISNNQGGVPDEGAAAVAPPMAPAPMASALPAAGEPMPGDAAMAGGSTAFVPGTKAAATPAPGRLAVSLTGDAVSEVWVTPAAGGPGVGPELKAGAFSIGLAAGEYHLELVVAGKRLRTTRPLAVPAGGERRLAVVVKGGTLTIEEQVPLEETPAAPAASPSPTP